MSKSTYRVLLLAAVASTLQMAGVPSAAAQTCPGAAYRMVVPAAPGGTTDIVARVIAKHLSDRMGSPVVVENKAGAGGTIGAAQVAQAKPDGCTMLMGNVGPNAINYSLNKHISYTPADFEPVTDVLAVPNVLVVNPNVAAKSLLELIELAKRAPGTLALANSGTGQSTHMTAEMFRLKTGVDVIQVPYKGNAPAVADLVAGQVQMMFDNVAVSLPHIQAGKLRALAVTSAQRVASLPDVPTLAESGVPGFEVVAWFGLFYPAGTNSATVAALHKNVDDILGLPSVQQQIATWSGVPGGRPPSEFKRYVNDEIRKWQQVVESANLRIE